MNETRQVQRNALDELLSIDVDSFLTDASETDFVFREDAPQTRSFSEFFSTKRSRRALLVATCASVLFALFFLPYMTGLFPTLSNDAQIAKKMEDRSSGASETAPAPSENAPKTQESSLIASKKTLTKPAARAALASIETSSVTPKNRARRNPRFIADVLSDDLDFWSCGSRFCDSLTLSAFDSTDRLYRRATLEITTYRRSLAQIAEKYSSMSEPSRLVDGNKSGFGSSKDEFVPDVVTGFGTRNETEVVASDKIITEKVEKKVDRKGRAKYTSDVVFDSSSQAPLLRSDSVKSTPVCSQENERYGGVFLLSLDPVFYVVQEIYIQNKGEEEQARF